MAKARPSSSDIDRFLEEVNRRKQQQARQSAPPPPPVQRAPKPIPPASPKVQQKQVVLPEPLVRAVVIESRPEIPVVREYVPKVAQQPVVTPPITVPTDNRVVQQVKSMLRSREGLRAMFVMNEILSSPRCKRPFRQ